MTSEIDLRWMQYALEIAHRGQGAVEPNPMVGCVIVKDEQIIAEGWHEQYGQAHAEVNALTQIASQDLTDATLYVTLEPCSHHGKTSPCSQAVIESGIKRVVVAMRDPFPEVDGRGISQLEDAGIEVTVGVAEDDAKQLNAPYLLSQTEKRPWVIGKWAMTLDGKIATHKGSSQWISSKRSREIVHQIRGRVDGIVVGHQTALVDNPLLTARPTGIRKATRIVVACNPNLSMDSQLVQSAADQPVIVTAGPDANPGYLQELRQHGVEVLTFSSNDSILTELLGELGRRHYTNLLVEGGAGLLGTCFDQHLLDEAHIFIAPKFVGSADAPTPIGGQGIEQMSDAIELTQRKVESIDDDIYISGIVSHRNSLDV